MIESTFPSADPCEIFASESFSSDTAEMLYPDHRMQQGENEVAALLELVNYRRGRVLDLCCGVGIHLIPFVARDIAVVGVDLNPDVLQILVGRILVEYPQKSLTIVQLPKEERRALCDVEIIRGDIRELPLRPNEFHLVYCMFTSLGFFSANDHIKLFGRLADGLDAGGSLVIDLATAHLADRSSCATAVEVPEAKKVIERTMRLEGGRLHVQFSVTYPSRRNIYRFSVLMFDPAMLTGMLCEAGFGKVNVFGSLHGDAWSADADRIVAVASK